MLLTVILLSITCGVRSSEFHPVAPVGTAPVVTAASSQYFERTFNRLVATPLQPVIPIPPPAAIAPPIAPTVVFAPAPQPIIPALPLPPARPVVVDAKRTTLVPITPTNVTPTQNIPVNPNVAIAVATAQAAAPVATILLPPYPFGFPPSFGFIPQGSQSQFPDNDNRESTTRKSTTRVTTTQKEEEVTTPVPSNIDNSFAQALPSNQNVNFKQYLAPSPLPRPVPQPQRPLKFKTNVEVVPVPLAYIAPPPVDLRHHHDQHHHHHHHHQALKMAPHIHTFVPKTRIIIRPVNSHLRIRTVPAGLHANYGPPRLTRKVMKRYPQNIRSQQRDIEPTTFRPLNRPSTKPPRI